MKVTYEQAVRLKDAGFPQPGDKEQHSIDPRYENGVFIPTMTELQFAVDPSAGKPVEGYYSKANSVTVGDTTSESLVCEYIAQKHNVD